MLLLCALIVGSGSVWAEEVTFTFGKATGRDVSSYDAVTKSEVKVTVLNQANNSYMSDDTDVRIYQNKSFKVESTNSSKTITKMVISFVSTSYADATSKDCFDNVTTYSISGIKGTWAGDASSITFTKLNSSQVRISQIVVTIESKVTASLDHITLSGNYPTSFYEGDAFSHEGMTVTATYGTGEETTTMDVTASAIFSEPNMTQIGQQTITVTFNEKTASYDITVTELPTHTATFSVNGAVTSENFKEGVAITFPTVTAPTNYSFVGWTATDLAVAQNTAPTDLKTTAIMGNSDATFFAVFAIGSNSGSSDTYTLVSDDNDLSDGDKIILVSTGTYTASKVTYNFTVANGSVNENKLMDPVNVTIDNNKVTSSDVAPITLVAVSGGWKLQMGTQYLNIVSSKNNIVLDDNGVINTISISSNEATIGGITDGSDTRNIYYNPNSGNGRFAYYKSIQKTVSIYKQEGGVTYSGYCTTVPTSLSATVTSAGWATYAPAYAVEFAATTKAYIVKMSASEDVATLTAVESVPANTPVLLKGAGEHTMTVVASSATDVSENCLKVSDGNVGNGVYVLANKNNTVGFYRWNGGKLRAGKIYMEPASESRAFIGLPSMETTGVSDKLVNKEEMNREVYDLQGRRVNSSLFTLHSSLKKGLYIVNGKKVIIK